MSAQPWNRLWSSRVPTGLKRRANYTFFVDDATMTRLSKWQFCQLSRNASESLGSATACSSSLYCRQDALMWSRFERLKERRRGPAESLTLFSNDWFNLLFVWIYLGSYNLLAILNISLIINLKSAGMSKTMWYRLQTIPHKILDMSNYNYLWNKIPFFIFFLGLGIAVSKFHGFFRFFIYEP